MLQSDLNQTWICHLNWTHSVKKGSIWKSTFPERAPAHDPVFALTHPKCHTFSLTYAFICSFWFQRFHYWTFKYYFRYYYYYFIYLFILKFSSLNNSSKVRLSNLIFDIKNFTIYFDSFKYYFRYYCYYSIYLFILKNLKFPSLNKFLEFCLLNLISDLKNSSIHSYLFNDYFCYYYYPIHLFIQLFIYLKSHL